MEFKELEYERLVEEREIRRKIAKLDTDLAGLKKKYKKDKGELVKQLQALEKELDSGALQPKLFDGKYPEKEEQIGIPSVEEMSRQEQEFADHVNGEPKKNKGRKKARVTADTMVCEKTLKKVCVDYCGATNHEMGGCCECEKHNCKVRITAFGNARACKMEMGCSGYCPRLIDGDTGLREVVYKADIKKKETFTESAMPAENTEDKDYFEAAKDWYEKTPEFEVVNGCKIGLRTINKLATFLNINYDKAAQLWDHMIDERGGKLVYDKNLANAGKAPKGYRVFELHLDNKRIMLYQGGKGFFEYDYGKSKADTIRKFKYLMSLDDALDVNGVTDWLHKLPNLKFTLFRGDYQGPIYPMKRIRFMTAGHGWGKPEKFSNEQQYYARLEELRKNIDYIEA